MQTRVSCSRKMVSLFCHAASHLLFHFGVRLLYSSRPAPYTGESILEQTILIFTRGVFVERFSCFREFAIRRAMGTSLQPGNIGFSSSSFRARATRSTEAYSARKTGLVALQCIFGMLEIDFGVSDLSRFSILAREYPGCVCSPDSTRLLFASCR